MDNPLRNIPPINELLDSPQLRKLIDRINRNTVVSGARTFLEQFREEMQSAAADIKVPSPAELAERIAEWILRGETASLRPVINATGILLHTGLGRAPLAEAAIQEMAEVAAGYASVEMDLASGERSQRVRAVEPLLRELTGAEAALVVNNNAAATLLTLAALAADREVVVSRGQLVEIGGSYRLPDVMACSGARLREVGTTNKTRLADYEQALGEQTAALMRVHTSNYRIVGFSESVPLSELVALGHKHEVPVIDDLGSGALLDFARFGVAGEPTVPLSIKAGADVVLFSGDKLLGGPQCGIILGRRSLLERIARHPMMRAMRVGKLTLAGLAATLRLYRDMDLAERSLPLLSLLTSPPENLRTRAERLAPQLSACQAIGSAEAVEDTAYLGGGTLPGEALPTWCIAVTPAEGSIHAFASRLRTDAAIVGRVRDDRLLLDLRSVFPRQDTQLVAAIEALDRSHSSQTEQTDAPSSDPEGNPAQ